MNSVKPLLENFSLPISIESDDCYFNKLNEKLYEYQQYINFNFDENDDLKNNVSKNIENIVNSIKYTYNAELNNAYNSIYDIIKNYTQHRMIVSTLDDSPAIRGLTKIRQGIAEKKSFSTDFRDQIASVIPTFFKARITENSTVYNNLDLLHIPFDKRYLVSSQRFSIPGVPCMYFGTTSYVCFIELDQPCKENIYFSSYKINPEKKVLNLSITQQLINGLIMVNHILDTQEVQDILEFFPLIIATSFKVVPKEEHLNQTRFFKSDYIVSQLVMQCLKPLKIDGIAYVSKKFREDTHDQLKTNFAFPIFHNIDSTSEDYGDFAKELKMTSPKTLKELINISNKNLQKDSNFNFSEVWTSYDKTKEYNKMNQEINFKKIDRTLSTGLHHDFFSS